MNLFDAIVKSPHPNFEHVRSNPHKLAARGAMEEAFSTFVDSDGNFVEQFQTTGFDARTFELYLHAALAELGMSIQRPSAPDFILEAAGVRFALEATTSNPSRSGVLAEHGTQLLGLGVAERQRYIVTHPPTASG